MVCEVPRQVASASTPVDDLEVAPAGNVLADLDELLETRQIGRRSALQRCINRIGSFRPRWLNRTDVQSLSCGSAQSMVVPNHSGGPSTTSHRGARPAWIRETTCRIRARRNRIGSLRPRQQSRWFFGPPTLESVDGGDRAIDLVGRRPDSHLMQDVNQCSSPSVVPSKCSCCCGSVRWFRRDA